MFQLFFKQMAEVVQQKGHGSKFAERQLLRHGWEHGKGLGRAEDGISEAIKVKVKCDKGGVGHKEGEQFTFHWWDHVFNKASSSLQVESDQNGVQLKKTAEDDEDEMISNKKPQKAARAKEKLYGCFVKSATLLSGQEQPEPKSSDSAHGSSSEDEDHRLDHSGTFGLTDEALMKVCGGRTAHKGARHGLTMSAKLARLEQQEAEFMAKYGQKNQSASLVCATPTCQSADRRAERQKDEAFLRKKKKKKSSVNGQSEAPESPKADVEPKQKKKERSEDGTDGKTRRKQKKTRRDSERDEEGRTSSPAAETPETKMKKSCKHHRELEEIQDSVQSEPPPNSAVRTKKKKSSLLDVTENEHEKCQEDKHETLPPKKKKKKKSKE